MKPRHKKLALIGGALAVIGIIAALVLNALNSNIALYITPTDVAAGKAPQGKAFRIGGMVKEGSLQRQADGVTVDFVITDTDKDIPVAYTGILPDLFKEGKGAVAQGKLDRRRHLHRQRGAGQARRKLHAAGSRQGTSAMPSRGRPPSTCPPSSDDQPKASY